MKGLQDIDQGLNIKLSDKQVKRITAVLVKQPYDTVADIINELKIQGEAEQSRISDEMKKVLAKEVEKPKNKKKALEKVN